MSSNYVKIERVGSLDAVLNKLHVFVQNLIFTVLIWNINNLNSVKKKRRWSVGSG